MDRVSVFKRVPSFPFVRAAHACAYCCSDCLSKWWKVPKGTDIPPERQSRIVDFLMEWIDRQLNA